MGDIASEPSMEDILTSIKKIIAEDGERPVAAPRKHIPVLRRDDPETARLDRRPAMEDEPKAAAPIANRSPVPDVDDVLELTETVRADQTVPPVESGPIISATAESASREALAQLSRMVVKPDVSGSDTLEGLVREMLKPMLKQWLDANLPALVERVVTQEVARIAGRQD